MQTIDNFFFFSIELFLLYWLLFFPSWTELAVETTNRFTNKKRLSIVKVILYISSIAVSNGTVKSKKWRRRGNWSFSRLKTGLKYFECNCGYRFSTWWNFLFHWKQKCIRWLDWLILIRRIYFKYTRIPNPNVIFLGFCFRFQIPVFSN